LAGLIASGMVIITIRGGCKRKDNDPYGDVQFAQVHSHEHELMT